MTGSESANDAGASALRALLSFATLVVMAVVGAVCWQHSEIRGGRHPQQRLLPESSATRVLDADEMVGAESLRDWATNADLVALVTVVDEQADTTVDPGSPRTGGGGVGRMVTVKLLDRLWTAAGASRAPDEIDLQAWGWVQTRAEGRIRLGGRGGSRMAVGGTYLAALAWGDATCLLDEGSRATRWHTIGSAGVLPAEDGVIGRGELEGEVVDESHAQVMVADGSVIDRFHGPKLHELVAALNRTRVDRTHPFTDRRFGSVCLED